MTIVRARFAGWTFGGDALAGLGVVWASATANELAVSGTALALTWRVAAQLTVTAELSRAWSLQLALQGGYAAGPRFTADDRTLASLAGPYGGAGIGVVYTFAL